MASGFQVSWLRPQLDRHPSALQKVLCLCDSGQGLLCVACLKKSQEFFLWNAAGLCWPLSICVHFTVQLRLPVPDRCHCSESGGSCSAGISRNRCPQAGLCCKIPVCQASKIFHVHELGVNREKTCLEERANRQSADIYSEL